MHSEGRTFRWTGEYEENMNVRHTLETQLNVLEEFEAEVASHRIAKRRLYSWQISIPTCN